ncbi:hypothetical protein HOG16_01770 [Candidatus Woesearchaeota archaeon]|nr:hypothetical protein [Candidatus Woesearchaeota archaeon]MBT4321907.1 hypothetical protein [Candidatus Woesearchaeota archaeon]
MASTLQNTIQFLRDFGFFDVVLPFLLFFAIIFAFLEKTKILGEDKSNVNLIVALSVSLLTVAANKVVSLISDILPNMILILVLIVMFVMITGVFFKEDSEDFYKAHKGWFKFFMFVLFILTLAFILNAMPSDSGTWLDKIIDGVTGGAGGETVGGIIFLVIIVGAIYLITRDRNSGGKG